jgi:hypothetical protein
MVKQISMNVDETLELDYLVKQINDDAIDVTGQPNGASFSLDYGRKQFGIFDPSDPGTYTFDIDGQTIEIQVTDIPDSGVSRWTFDNDDTNSGTAIDVWGRNDGTINGATTGVSGANVTYTTNEAYSFDGTDDYIDASVSLDSTSNGVSVAVWHKPDFDTTAFSNPHQVFRNKSGSSNNWGILYDSSSNALTTNWSNSSVAYSPSTNYQNTWTHLAYTVDSSNSPNITLYIDGSSVNSGTFGSGVTVNHSNADFEIGRRIDNNGAHFSGDMDDFRVYDKALTSTEVSNLYNNGSV